MRLLRMIALVLAPLLLTSCLLTAGEFTAEMTVAPDGGFTYAYRGEIVFAMAGGPQDTDMNAGATVSNPVCYKETTGAERPCTPAEIEAQTEYLRDPHGVDAMQTEMMRLFLGDVDPRDDASMRAFAARLATQRGWRSVSYRGNGIFDVDYAITGRLDRDFIFPVASDMALMFPMVTAVPRNDGTVLIEAPAFVGVGDVTGVSADNSEAPPLANGSFTIRSTAEVVESNATEQAGDVLTWTVSQNQRVRPSATIRIVGS